MNVSGVLKRIGLGLIILPSALFGVGWLLTLGDYPVPPTVAEDPGLPAIEANGYRFHGEIHGRAGAPLIVAIHGGPGWDYRSLLPLRGLADRYRVLFYDQRGSGLSPRVPDDQLTITTALEDLDAIVDAYGAGRAILIGHSWGAMLAADYLGKHPQKVPRAVLAEPGFLNGALFRQAGLRLGPRWEAGYLWFAATKWFESLHIRGPDQDSAADYFLAAAAAHANPEYYCEGRLPPAATDYWRAGARAMQAVLASADGGRGLDGFDLTQGLENYRRPVLLMASGCNQMIGEAQQRRQIGFFPQAELVVIPGSGHMIFAEQSALAMAAVRDFLGE